MRAWILLFCLSLIGVSCTSEYEQVSKEELIAMDLKAQVESVTVDFNNRRERWIHINNHGDRIEFPVFAMWVTKTPEQGVTSIPFDSGHLCMQYLPIEGDSLFKLKGSRKIKVYIRKKNSVDSILVVDRKLMEKTLKLDFKSPAKEAGLR